MSEFESHEVEIEVDLAAFLPEGVEIQTDEEPEPAPELAAEDPADDQPEPEAEAEGAAAPAIDLDALRQIELDLDAVDAAIAALDAGTYGIDPATGAPIDDALLAADPTRLS